MTPDTTTDRAMIALDCAAAWPTHTECLVPHIHVPRLLSALLRGRERSAEERLRAYALAVAMIEMAAQGVAEEEECTGTTTTKSTASSTV
jgi:hypothetical protein